MYRSIAVHRGSLPSEVQAYQDRPAVLLQHAAARLPVCPRPSVPRVPGFVPSLHRSLGAGRRAGIHQLLLLILRARRWQTTSNRRRRRHRRRRLLLRGTLPRPEPKGAGGGGTLLPELLRGLYQAFSVCTPVRYANNPWIATVTQG